MSMAGIIHRNNAAKSAEHIATKYIAPQIFRSGQGGEKASIQQAKAVAIILRRTAAITDGYLRARPRNQRKETNKQPTRTRSG